MATETQSSRHQLAEQLAEGFIALSTEYQALLEKRRQLDCKLGWAKQQYLEVLKRQSPDKVSQDHFAFLQKLEHVQPESPRESVGWLDQLSRSEHAETRQRYDTIRQAENALSSSRSTAEKGVTIWNGPSADRTKPKIRMQSNASELEKDFTTAGTPSKLGCPFASNSAKQSSLTTPRSSLSHLSLKGPRSKRPSFCDPIRAEICRNNGACASTSASTSLEGSAAVCPIRFLNQHEPEELAQYFEKHKHELPRSHEVCVGRFQSNTESVQELDRKYGNLVNMIQGLGVKHQAWLPDEPEEPVDHPQEEAQADAKVEKWATDVTESLQNHTPEHEDPTTPGQVLDESRTAHFDRPMKEIRVGESPSRPWGITIPAKYTNAESSSSVGSAPTASPPLPLDLSQLASPEATSKPRCPFGKLAEPNQKVAQVQGMADGAEQRSPPLPNLAQPGLSSKTQHIPPTRPTNHQDHARKASAPDVPKTVPQMVFNGPVFLGYPPDQLLSILQNSNLAGSMR